MIRAATPPDIQAAAPLLARAFAGYRDALVYSPEVLALFQRLWWTPVRGQVAVLDGELVGVAFVGLRTATLRGRPVRLAHVGPVAVDPRHQGLGLGTALMRGLEPQADLLTLTTNDAEGVRGFYEALGYERLEHFLPWVRELGVEPADDRVRPARDTVHFLREQGPDAGTLFGSERAGLRTIVWPVTSRRGGQVERLQTCQVLSRHGSGAELDEALRQACEHAASQECEIIWARHDVADGLPGFHPGAGAGVSRMVLPQTPRGRAVVEEARGYVPRSPSP